MAILVDSAMDYGSDMTSDQWMIYYEIDLLTQRLLDLSDTLDGDTAVTLNQGTNAYLHDAIDVMKCASTSDDHEIQQRDIERLRVVVRELEGYFQDMTNTFYQAA